MVPELSPKLIISTIQHNMMIQQWFVLLILTVRHGNLFVRGFMPHHSYVHMNIRVNSISNFMSEDNIGDFSEVPSDTGTVEADVTSSSSSSSSER